MHVTLFLLSAVTLIAARPQELDFAFCQPNRPSLLPHEWDCTKFYSCKNAQRGLEERECAPETHFSFVLQTCVDPKEASCISKLVEDLSVKESHDENSARDNECPSGSSVYLLLPHESDCDLYYQCVHGSKVLRQCALGTHFDAKNQRCNWPWAAGCESEDEDSEIKESKEDSGEDGDGEEGGEDGEDSVEGEDGGENSTENNSEENGEVNSNETKSEEDSNEDDDSKSSKESSSKESSSEEDNKNNNSLTVGLGVNLRMSKVLKT